MDNPIIIIGSGLSGFAAARRLMDNDFNNIIILEAENRIGGRINSVPFSDGIIDLGAQWVHGQKNNLIYEMTRNNFDFGTTPFEEMYSTFLLTNGTKPDQKDIRKIVDVAYKIIDDIDELEDPQGTIGELFIKKFDKALKSSKLKNIEPSVIELMKENIQRNYNGYMATSSWFDVSAKKNSQESKASGNQYLTWKKQGFKTIFDFLTVSLAIIKCYRQKRMTSNCLTLSPLEKSTKSRTVPQHRRQSPIEQESNKHQVQS